MQQNQTERYLELVKEVGLQLRALLTSVDSLVPYFPQSAHKQVRSITVKHDKLLINTSPSKTLIFLFQVEMAHKVLSKDMAELVNAMKIAQKYCHTAVDYLYSKSVLLNRIL